MRPTSGAALSALVFLSGSAALLLQVLWARDFALAFGATAIGTALVLSAYFTGLMLGAELGGRLARGRSSAALYATLEAGVAAATALYLIAARPWLDAAAAAAGHGPALQRAALQWLLALGVLLAPTTLIGATLPAALAAAPRRDAAAAARLYAWNTLGGAVGALAALLAVYRIGTRNSFALAAALDLGVAVLAAALVPRQRRAAQRRTIQVGAARAASAAERRSATADAVAARQRLARRTALAAGLAGFAGLADEVLWARGLSGVLSNSVYSIALVLGAVLLALVVGARLAAALLRDRARLGLRLSLACSALALSTLLSREALRFVPQIGGALAAALRVSDPLGGLAVEALVGMAIVFVPATCLGAIFPLCVGYAGAAPRHALGRLLAANTLGGLLGAPAAAFLFLPILGLGGGLLATSALAATAALALAEQRAARGAVALCAALIALAAALSPGVHLEWLGRYGAERLLFYRDGAAATVLVTEDARGMKRLLVNGQYSLGGSEGLLLERRQAHIPLLLHAEPRRVLLLGVGTGATLGAALAHPGVHVDAVEIVPEVLEAAARLFAPDNESALGRPEAHVEAQDARAFLRSTSERYDVIVGELFLPWTAGTAYLYSQELLELAQSRLAPSGIYCQWLPLHQLALTDLQAIVATFARAFPHAELWLAYHRATAPIAALVGSSEPIALDRARLQARLAEPQLARAVRAVGLDDAADLTVLRVAGDARLRAATAAATSITDDRPSLEFSAPQAYFHQPGLAAAALEWMTTLVGSSDSQAGATALDAERADLVAAQLALLRGDGPGELRAYLAALEAAPEVPATRRALVAIERTRLAAGDARTAAVIADALKRFAAESDETRRATAALAEQPHEPPR